MKHIAIGLALILASGGANAAVINWSASLAPENEVPPVTTSDGSGSAMGTVDTVTGLLTWEVMWMNLTGPAIGLHFHAPATTSENAGVVVNIGDISGLMSPSIGSTTISAPQVSGLLAELWYINVHTERHSGGEIRGQVIPASVPLPGTMSLFVAGVTALLGIARRRS